MQQLNEKQSRFCEEYVVDLNATAAAIRAGYSEKTARSQGQRLLTNADIQARISSLRQKQIKRTEISADTLVNHLASQLFADVAEILEDSGSLKPVSDWPLLWRQGLVSGLDVSEAGEVSVSKVRLADRLRIAEMLARHVGMFEPESRPKSETPTRLLVEITNSDDND